MYLFFAKYRCGSTNNGPLQTLDKLLQLSEPQLKNKMIVLEEFLNLHTIRADDYLQQLY